MIQGAFESPDVALSIELNIIISNYLKDFKIAFESVRFTLTIL